VSAIIRPARTADGTPPERLNPCKWCGKRNRTASDWEQRNLSGVWQRLCVRCASRRLDNPWNGLLPMRKVGSA
jgi:hypothetical protein